MFSCCLEVYLADLVFFFFDFNHGKTLLDFFKTQFDEFFNSVSITILKMKHNFLGFWFHIFFKFLKISNETGWFSINWQNRTGPVFPVSQKPTDFRHFLNPWSRLPGAKQTIHLPDGAENQRRWLATFRSTTMVAVMHEVWAKNVKGTGRMHETQKWSMEYGHTHVRDGLPHCTRRNWPH
jgi:hypothetical protein